MTQPRAYHTRAHRAKQRRRQQERERLQREQARADLGLPETVADEVHGDCRGCFPSVLGYRSYRELGRELLVHLWQHVEGKSPATRSRWQWTWVGDDSLFKKDGPQLGLVGLWQSGQEHRVRLGIDGLLLPVVIGDGKLVIPVDFIVRRPDPEGSWRPCWDKLTWLQVMLERTWAALSGGAAGCLHLRWWRIAGLGTRA